MLDASLFPITLFSVENLFPCKTISDNRLVLHSCSARFGQEKIYSAFEEMNSVCINMNDYGCGYIEYEFSFEEHFKTPYMKFYLSAFSFRMDTLPRPIKENCLHPHGTVARALIPPGWTKVNRNGLLSISVLYYFKNSAEREAFLNCNELCIEGFIALNKKTNCYGMVCRLKKSNNTWELIDANTYHPYKRKNIDNCLH